MSTIKITQPDSEEVFENVDDVFGFIYEWMQGSWPRNAKLYFEGNEQSLESIEDIHLLTDLEGSFEIVIEPEGVIAAVSAVAFGAAAIRRSRNKSRNNVAFSRPQQFAEVKSQDPQNLQSNNKISGQSNEVRTAKRIPDIFGQVRAYPDLMFPSYVSGNSIIGAYCLGRGDHAAEDFKIDEKAVAAIPGLSIEVYGPNTSPNNSEPHTRIGEEITEQLSTYEVIYEQEDGTSYPTSTAAKLSVSAKLEGSGPAVSFKVVLTRVSDQATQEFAGVVESAYGTLPIDNPYAGQETQIEFVRTGFNREPDVYYTDQEYIDSVVGPFVYDPGAGPNGEDFRETTSADLDRYRDAEGNLPVKTVGAAIEQSLEEIEIAEITPCLDPHFGNITMIYTKSTEPFEGKMNLLATRKVPLLLEDSIFGPSTATRDAASILAAIATDPFIGRLTNANLNLESFRDSVDAAIARFGDNRASYFSYTFDDANLSFEDTAEIVCEAVFCNISRIGSVLEMNFEQPQDVPVLLFNDYNKMPNSESRNVVFGNKKNYDGVRLEYYDQVSGEAKTINVPQDLSANVEKPIKTVGIRTKFQAYFHAQREYQKLVNQTLTVGFDTTSEANLLKVNDLVVVSDSTRSVFESGEVLSFTDSEIEISNPVTLTFDSNYVVFLQTASGSVIKRVVTQGADKRRIQLSTPITDIDLSVDPDNFAKCLYTIVEDADSDLDLFLVTKKSVKEGLVLGLELINYSDEYYSRDRDFIDGLFVDTEDDQVTTFGATAPLFRYIRSGSLLFYPYQLGTIQDANCEAYDVNGDAITYTFEGADGALFEVDENFRLRFKTTPDINNPTDSDTNNFYELIVRISDGTLSRTAQLTVGVVDAFTAYRSNNVNRNPLPPYFINLTDGQVAPVQENIAVSFFTVRGYDVNGDTIKFFVIGGADSSKFDIDINTGDLSFIQPPDFENPVDSNADNIYEVRIRISDGNLFSDATLLVEVSDLAEGT